MGDDKDQHYSDIAERLVALYDEPFGSKKRGRFRISMKLIRTLFEKRRVWPQEMESLRRALYEQGYILIDLETYCVVVSLQTFANYRRVNDTSVRADHSEQPATTRRQEDGDAVVEQSGHA